ncbi:unnamed protein product [Aphanomyces euteiches]|uniref:Uncharacterized protein n=1 Tax=Aphanomyces euteiches TaxID=100861 RepID=A0A6G0XQ90_9STRA|nr:hypothetical protein Ae201684_002559 [Aphanomyces euteiches]KAH9092959.1 hypothetical protein Ae201684P_008625 [Aphanomyces euteiches]KAH9146322.1 hypothetical protein AeRB84_009800 [Aphanomyces euteiches]
MSTSDAKPTANANASLDSLIFEEQKATAPSHADHADEVKEDEPESEEKKSRTSISNLLPVDKLKNGATNASKFLGSTFATLKENSAKSWEQAKQTKAGGALASGLSTASSAASVTAARIKESDAYKNTSSVASKTLENAKIGASIGLEKAKHGAEIVSERAKQGAQLAKEGAVHSMEKVRSVVTKPGDDQK